MFTRLPFMDEESNLSKATVVLISRGRTWTQEVWFQNLFLESLHPIIELLGDKDIDKVCTWVIVMCWRE